MRSGGLVALITAVVAATFAACGGGDESTGSRPEVVAGFYPLAEAVQRVGGGRIAVENLTPAGAVPHDLELTPDQVDAIQDAALVVLMGRGFQPALEDSAGGRDGPTVEVLDELPIDARGRTVEDEHAEDEQAEEVDEHEGDALDPHVWLDPVLFAQMVDVVARELGALDPEHRDEYERNAAAFRRDIERVDADYREGLAECARRTIVTSHAAFGYLVDRYGLTQEAIAGIDPDAEPGAQRLAELADLVADEGITTIFTEDLVSPRVADALAREAGGVRTETLNPLEGLTPRERDRGDDWASVMERNLTKLRAALDCR